MDILFALATGIAFGAMTTALSLALRRGFDPARGAVVLALVTCAIGVPFGLLAIAAGAVVDAGELWRYVVVGLVSPGLSTITYTHAVGVVGASRVGILIATAPVVAAVLAVILLDEPVEAALVCAALLIAAGGILLAWDGDRPTRPRAIGLGLAAVTALFFAVQAISVRWATEGSDAHYLVALAVVTTTGSLVMLAYWGVRGLGSVRQIPGMVSAFTPTAVLFVVAYIGFISAYERGRVTVVAPLTATEALWTVLFAALFIGRVKDAIGPRVLMATVLVVCGTLLVTTFG